MRLNDDETLGIFFNGIHGVRSRSPSPYDFKKPITSGLNPQLCASSQDSLNKICSACPDSELEWKVAGVGHYSAEDEV